MRHRLLQLAANIYDSTTVHPFDGNFPIDQLSFPSVFRPTFTNFVFNGVTNVIINGYTTNLFFSHPVDAVALASGVTNADNNVYGIPWVIGARKGFPNLNKLAMQSTFSVTRKLQIVKPEATANVRATWHTNVQYGLSITNTVGVQAWNSYARTYPRGVTIFCFDEVGVVLTNQIGTLLGAARLYQFHGDHSDRDTGCPAEHLAGLSHQRQRAREHDCEIV